MITLFLHLGIVVCISLFVKCKKTGEIEANVDLITTASPTETTKLIAMLGNISVACFQFDFILLDTLQNVAYHESRTYSELVNILAMFFIYAFILILLDKSQLLLLYNRAQSACSIAVSLLKRIVAERTKESSPKI